MKRLEGYHMPWLEPAAAEPVVPVPCEVPGCDTSVHPRWRPYEQNLCEAHAVAANAALGFDFASWGEHVAAVGQWLKRLQDNQPGRGA